MKLRLWTMKLISFTYSLNKRTFVTYCVLGVVPGTMDGLPRWKGFLGGSDGKEPVCNVGDLGSIPGLGKSPSEGNGNPLQYSCLENSMDSAPGGCSPWNPKESDTTEWQTATTTTRDKGIKFYSIIYGICFYSSRISLWGREHTYPAHCPFMERIWEWLMTMTVIITIIIIII